MSSLNLNLNLNLANNIDIPNVCGDVSYIPSTKAVVNSTVDYNVFPIQTVGGIPKESFGSSSIITMTNVINNGSEDTRFALDTEDNSKLIWENLNLSGADAFFKSTKLSHDNNILELFSSDANSANINKLYEEIKEESVQQRWNGCLAEWTRAQTEVPGIKLDDFGKAQFKYPWAQAFAKLYVVDPKNPTAAQALPEFSIILQDSVAPILKKLKDHVFNTKFVVKMWRYKGNTLVTRYCPLNISAESEATLVDGLKVINDINQLVAKPNLKYAHIFNYPVLVLDESLLTSAMFNMEESYVVPGLTMPVNVGPGKFEPAIPKVTSMTPVDYASLLLTIFNTSVGTFKSVDLQNVYSHRNELMGNLIYNHKNTLYLWRQAAAAVNRLVDTPVVGLGDIGTQGVDALNAWNTILNSPWAYLVMMCGYKSSKMFDNFVKALLSEKVTHKLLVTALYPISWLFVPSGLRLTTMCYIDSKCSLASTKTTNALATCFNEDIIKNIESILSDNSQLPWIDINKFVENAEPITCNEQWLTLATVQCIKLK